MPFPTWPLPFTFLFGLIVGSFLNVLIVRLPKDEDLITPSHCPSCFNRIKWYDNIPLLSYALLLGKCRRCHISIPPTYPLVEFTTGVAACLIAPAPLEPAALFRATVLFSTFCVFLCHFIIDLRHKILPDQLNGYLGLLFLLNGVLFSSWTHYGIGALVGAGVPYLIAWIFSLLRGQVGLGGGDIKLYGVLGLHLGPLGVLQNIFFSSLLGSLIAGGLILLKKVDKKDYIPFGPFIIAVASLQIFFPETFQQYLSLLML